MARSSGKNLACNWTISCEDDQRLEMESAAIIDQELTPEREDVEWDVSSSLTVSTEVASDLSSLSFSTQMASNNWGDLRSPLVSDRELSDQFVFAKTSSLAYADGRREAGDRTRTTSNPPDRLFTSSNTGLSCYGAPGNMDMSRGRLAWCQESRGSDSSGIRSGNLQSSIPDSVGFYENARHFLHTISEVSAQAGKFSGEVAQLRAELRAARLENQQLKRQLGNEKDSGRSTPVSVQVQALASKLHEVVNVDGADKDKASVLNGTPPEDGRNVQDSTPSDNKKSSEELEVRLQTNQVASAPSSTVKDAPAVEIQVLLEEVAFLQEALSGSEAQFSIIKSEFEKFITDNSMLLDSERMRAEGYYRECWRKETQLSQERRDREKLMGYINRTRRDHEFCQQKISSLQEQIHKYQDHIKKLNMDLQSRGGVYGGKHMLSNAYDEVRMPMMAMYDGQLQSNPGYGRQCYERNRSSRFAPPLRHSSSAGSIPEAAYNVRGSHRSSAVHPSNGCGFEGFRRNSNGDVGSVGFGSRSSGYSSRFLRPQTMSSTDPWNPAVPGGGDMYPIWGPTSTPLTGWVGCGASQSTVEEGLSIISSDMSAWNTEANLDLDPNDGLVYNVDDRCPET